MAEIQTRDEIFPATPNKTYALMELVKRSTPSVDRGPDDTVMSWPNLVLPVTLLAIGTTLFVFVVSLFLNAPLKEIANPDVTENPAKAPWYFLSLQELLLHMDPTLAGVIVPSIVVLALIALPYLDHARAGSGVWFDSARGMRISLIVALGTLLLVPLLVLLDVPMVKVGENLVTLRHAAFGQTLLGAIIVPLAAMILPLALLLLILWRLRATTREIALALFTVFVIAAATLTIIGVLFRGPGMQLFWPWAMPAPH